MDRVIKQIMDTEAEAQKIVGEAKAQEKNLDKNIAAELNAYRETSINNAKKMLKAEIDNENKALFEKISELELDTNRRIIAMGEAAKIYRKHWIDSIFGDIIKSLK